MLDFFLLPRLPGRDDRFAGLLFKKDSTAFLLDKILELQLAPVDERESETIGNRRAQLFHQVERETGTTRPVGMEKSNRGIEADALKRRLYIVAQERIDE